MIHLILSMIFFMFKMIINIILQSKTYLEDLVLVRLEGVQLEFQIPEIPESDGLVGRTRGQDELGVRVKGQAVHFGGVRVDGVRWLIDKKGLNNSKVRII